jgi:hypothetical protein
MKKEEQLVQKDDLNPDNVISMFPEAKLLTAPKGPTGHDWLSPLPVGTIFVCKPKPEAPISKIFLQEYIVDTKFTKSIKLLSNMNEPDQYAVVDPFEFCKMFDLHETLHEPSEEKGE